MLVGFICAFIGTIAFSHLFNVQQKHYWWCGIVGAVGYVCYCLADIRTTVTFATFFATLVVVLFSRILTVKRRCPITIFLVSGIFPLVPGASVYNTAYYFVMNDLAQATIWGINSLKVAFAIVLGIVFIVAIPRQMFTTEYWKIWKKNRDKKKVAS